MSHGPQTFSAVIFDCDGVLVDSELLSASVLKVMMAENGHRLSTEMFGDIFLGRSFASAVVRAQTMLNIKLSEDFEAQYRDRLFADIAQHLQAMPGVTNVLEALHVPYCLATSSSPKRLALSLKTARLESYFAGRCYTTADVKHAKPAPDLCFYAAAKMNVDPAECLVIEDSEMGVRAGLAAGMTVWHFTGGAHMQAGYQLPDDLFPAKVLVDMPALLLAFQDLDMA